MITKEFEGQDHIVFGDVNLQESPIRDPKYGVGAGGWPTVRVFNQETGYDGKAYEKVTEKSMCDELGGDGEYLRNFVNTASSKPCTVADQTFCNDKQKTFIKTFTAKTPAEQQSELERLRKMSVGTNVKKELLTWLNQRSVLLADMLKVAGQAGEL